MKHTMKKTLAFLLTLVMLVNTFPLSVFADQDPGMRKVNPVGLKSGLSSTATVAVDGSLNPNDLYIVFRQVKKVAAWGNSDQNFYAYQKYETGTSGYSCPDQMTCAGTDPQNYDDSQEVEAYLIQCNDGQPLNYIHNAIRNGGKYNSYPVTITPDGMTTRPIVITVGNTTPCSVTFTKNDAVNLDGYYYYAIASKNGSAIAYAQLTDTGYLFSTETLYTPVTFSIVKTTAELTTLDNLANITEATVTTSGGKIGNIRFTWNTEPTNNTYTINAKPANDDVFINVQLADGSAAPTLRSGYYYLVVGWHDGVKSYAKELLDYSLVGNYSFNKEELPHTGSTLFVLLKKCNNASDEPRSYDGDVIITNNSDVGPSTREIELDGERYTFSISEQASNEGKRYFTITVSKAERAKHTANITLPSGFDTTGMYVVFRQPISGSDEKAYCAVPVTGSGNYESTAKLINPSYGEQDFSADAATEVEIIKTDNDPTTSAWMFQNSHFNSNNGLTVYGNGSLYNGQETQIVTITPDSTDTNKTNISIGEANYTARLDLYDPWDKKHEGSVTFTESVEVTASGRDGTAYTGTITGDGVFLTEFDSLPADLTNWRFVPSKVDGYIFSTTPTKEGTVYVLEARKPDTYQVKAVYKEAWGEEEAKNIIFSAPGTITATGEDGTVYTGKINTDGTVTMDLVPAISSWQINDNNKIGEYLFTASSKTGQENPSVDTGAHTYTLTLRKERTHRVDIEYYDSWGRGKMTGDVPVGAGYTIKATAKDGTVYTGTVDTATGAASFEQELPEISSWTVKHNGTAENPQAIGEFRTDFGTDNPYEVARYDSVVNNAVGYYVITALKPNTYSADLAFYAAEGDDPLDNVNLPESYVIKATAVDGTTVYTGTVATDGSVTWDVSDGWQQISEFKFYKANGTDEVTRFGSYLMEVVSYDDTSLYPTYGAYQIIGRAAKLYPSMIKYAPENTADLDAYYYLVASVEGEKVAYAALPKNTSRLTFIPFGGATGKLDLRMRLADASGTPAAAGTKLPEDTVFTLVKSDSALSADQIYSAAPSSAVVNDYTLELKPDIEKTHEGAGTADEDTLVLKAQKQWTGNQIKITTYGYDGKTAENPDKPFGDNYYLRVLIRDQATNADIGWNLIKIDDWNKLPHEGQADTTTITVDRFTTLGEKPLDGEGKNIWTTFNPSLHYIEVDTDEYPARVIKLKDRNNVDWTKANNPNDINDEPPEGYNYIKGSQESDYYQIKLAKAKPVDYHVRLKFDTTDTTKINLDGGLYLKVTIGHQTGEDTYGWVKLDNAGYKNREYMTVDTENGCIYIDVPITEWKNAEGHPAPLGERYKGTEENIKVELVGTSSSDAKPRNSVPMKTGSYVNNAEITAYPTMTKDVDRFEEENDTTKKITDVITLDVEPDQFDGYSLEYILNGYNIVTLCPNQTASPSNSGESAFGDGDFLMKNHCMGGVLIRGDIIHIFGTGVADSEYITKPSVVGGYVPQNGQPFINNRENNNNDWNGYVGSVNTVVGETVNGVTANGSPSKARPDGTIRGYTGSAGHTAAYGDTYVDWDHLQQTVRDDSDHMAEAGRVVDGIKYEDDYHNPLREVTVKVTLGDNVTINYPEGVILTVDIQAPEGLDLQDSDNIPSTVINNTGSGTYIAPRVKVNGQNLSTVEDGSGMSLVWNYPNATRVNLTTEVTPFFGHIVAPRSYIDVEGGNYSGCMVGNKVSSAGEGHLYPYNGGKLVLTDVGFEATKTIDEVPPEADKLFYFELSELDQDGSLKGQAGEWVRNQLVRNNEGSIQFEEIKYTIPGTYYYKISEYQASVSSDIRLDTTQYIVKSVVEEHVSGTTTTLTSTETYYVVPEGVTDFLESYTENETTVCRINESVLTPLNVPEGKTGAEIAAEYLKFDNKSNDNASITVRKTLQNENLQADQFAFTIEKKTAPDASVGSVDETKLVSPAKNSAGGSVNFGKLGFTLEDGQYSGTWVYTVKEDVPNPIPADSLYIYDQSEYEITFNVTRTNGTLNVEKSIKQVKDENGNSIDKAISGINFVNERKTGDLKISKTVVSPIPAEETQTFSFTVQLTNGNKKVSGKYGSYTFDADGKATIEIAGGSTVTIPDLPTGTTYTITEATEEKFTSEVIEGSANGTIAEGENKVAFKNSRKLGKVSISKAVQSPIEAERTRSFTFTITLSNTTINGEFDGAVYEGTSQTATKKLNFENGIATVTVAGNERLEIEGLPAGVSYTITEAVDNYFTATKENDTGTITAEGTTAAFTNTRKLGDLKVEKQVTGTSDKTKEFHFTVVLSNSLVTPPAAYSGTFPVDVSYVSDATKGQFPSTITEGVTTHTITFTDGSASFKLKADEYIIIQNIPQGITYTVTEDTTSTQMPSGYELGSSGTAQGTIGDTLSTAKYVNNYHLETTSVGFGGVKSIEGTDSTEKVFTFELYETKSDYVIADNQQPLDTCSTTGVISKTAGQNYSFDAITYDGSGVTANTPKHYYYVVKEKALDVNEGWTIDSTIYNIHVTVSDDGHGKLTKTVQRYQEGQAEEDLNPGALNFKNTYEAKGTLKFKAKKIFTNGNLKQHPFKVRLTWVTADQSTEAVKTGDPETVACQWTAKLNADSSTQTVTFNNVKEFVKNATQNDTANNNGEYWFLIEELDADENVNLNAENIGYDAHPQRWIKVTVTDNGDGSLNVVKSPATTTNGSGTDLDVVFENEQLGSVQVQKSFSGVTALPDDFEITAEYTLAGQAMTTLHLNKDTAGKTGTGAGDDPFIWTINELPIGTEVTFAETGATIDGYTLVTTYEGNITADNQKLVAAKDAPTGKYINTYTRDTGKLQIQKTVSVNNQTTGIDYTLVDGTYQFHLKSDAGVPEQTDKHFTVTISGGTVSTAAFVDTAGDKLPNGVELSTAGVLSGLPTGKYTVEEELTDAQKAKGIAIAEKPQTAIEVGKYIEGTTTTIPTAAFRNNREVGTLEISKTITGTTDKTKDFEFTVELTAPTNVPLVEKYSVVTSDEVKNNTKNAARFDTDGKIKLDSVSNTTNKKSFTITLRADQSILIKDLPSGTTYTVTESASLPSGYEKTAPAGNPSGTIGREPSVAAFVNNYKLETTSVAFGGVKTIEGTDSTTKEFYFELYKTGEVANDNYALTTGQTPIQTVHTTGTIQQTAGKSFSFDAITYDSTDLNKTYYYVVKEKTQQNDGWTYSDKEYKTTVAISDNGGGQLQAVVTGDAPDQLDFTNTYEATGTVSFKAKKIFTNGNLSQHPFTIKLTQVGANGDENKITNGIESEATVNTGAEQTVEFKDVLTFTKNKTTNDTVNTDGTPKEYWFMIEEIDENQSTDDIRYDANPRRWIKITLTDEGNGTLTAVKDPSTTTDGSDTDLDAVFENEQLGSVQVTKVFKGLTETQYPANFKITATYGSETVELTKNSTGVSGKGTEAEPYVWTIDQLPIDTEVTFVEEGMSVNGYAVATTFTKKADNGTDDIVTTAKRGTIKAAKDVPIGAFVNTYTREEGSLKIKKTVQVNNAVPTDYSMVSGTYTFTVKGTGLADGTTKIVKITIANDGTITGKVGETDITPDADGYIQIDGLPTGNYEISEEITDDMTNRAIVLKDPENNKITKEVKANNSANIPTADFINEKKVGNLEISKTVSGTSDKEPVFEFEIALTKQNGGAFSGTYPVDATSAVMTLNGITGGSISFDNEGKATVKLHADEKITIKNLPVGISYTVGEKSPPDGYTKKSPGGNAEGSISTTASVVNFVNQYSVTETNITFSGRKTIEGTDSTEKEFVFELYKTGEDYKITTGQAPLQKVNTTGTIRKTAGKSFSFDAITYNSTDLNQTYYYVVKEKTQENDGWTYSDKEYKTTVTITDIGGGKLQAAVTGDAVDQLNFTNIYEATGAVTFKAKKTFTNGKLSDHPFKIRLTQVTGENSETQATGDDVILANPVTKTVSANASGQLVTFGKSDGLADFVRNKDKDSVADASGKAKEYWFLIEELDDHPNSNVVNDAHPKRWIKVTLKDEGNGTLTPVKEPAANNNLDVEFVNEQLGSVQVTKVFKGLTETQYPANFKITATYGSETVELTKNSAGVSGKGTEAEPYVWTIDKLPIGTEVTFTEEGMNVNGYAVATQFTKKADNGTDDVVTTATSGTVKAAKDVPTGAFVNTYTREEGSLKIKKTVQVNNAVPTDYSMVSGTYTFTVKGTGLADGTTKIVKITIANDGTISGKVGETNITLDTDGYVQIDGLPTGNYEISEEITADMTNRAIVLKDPENNKVTKEVKANNAANIPTVEFINEKEVGNLEISKTVSGTSDNTVPFTFVITLKNGESLFSGTYPIEATTAVETTNNIQDHKLTFTTGVATVQLHADEKITIKNLPVGISYKVEETNIPTGYGKIKPAGAETDAIIAGTKEAKFVNQYNLGTTSVSFGGMKTITGTNSSNAIFTFELYQVPAADAEIGAEGAKRLQQVSTTAPIVAHQNYSFDPITYTASDKNATYYYVIREIAKEKADTGWTTDVNNKYCETVTISDDGQGSLVATVTSNPSTAAADALNFTNDYEATGTVSFKAKKIFTNGNLSQHPFTIKLTQVGANGDENKITNGIESEATVNIGAEQTVEFKDVLTFTKNKTTNDMVNTDGTTKEYWFMIEEIDENQSTDDIRYDANPRRWIKITLTDEGNGTLTAVKDPSTTTDGSDTDLDAVFENEQLGSVKVTKVFKGLTETQYPANFKITAKYGSKTVELTKDSAGVSGMGTEAEPYIWTIDKLPIGTEVTFAENGMSVNGYAVSTTFTKKVKDADVVSNSISGTLTAAQTAPTGAFVNTYTRERGKMKLQKTVTVNGQEPLTKGVDNTLVDGTYIFNIEGTDALTTNIKGAVTLTIENGAVKADSASTTIPDATIKVEDGAVEIANLPTGTYNVTEDTTNLQHFITSTSTNRGPVTVSSGESTTIPTAGFNNNRDVGDLRISKTVQRTSNRTKEFEFTVTLQKDKKALSGTYPIEATSAVKTINGITGNEITFDSKGEKIIKLHADEAIIIRNLPGGTTYTVHEETPNGGYTQTKPAGGGNATGTISSKQSEAEFVNTYELASKSLVFEGKKYIDGIDSTTQTFGFEVYEADSSWTIPEGEKPILTAETSGQITKTMPGTISFGSLKYDQEMLNKDFYYVVLEKELKDYGWTSSTVCYYRHVHVKDNDGSIGLEVTDKGNTATVVSNLDFTNTYTATGSVSFNAKKVFTGGDLNRNPFEIRLTQVTGNNQTAQATNNIVLTSPINVSVPANGIVSFPEAAKFTKTVGRDDSANTYWFMLEEVTDGVDANNILNGVTYDTTRKWIKVTMTDDGKGSLIVEKSPAATNDNGTDIDAIFTNEQLGGVKVTKAFSGVDKLPDNFKIVASYKDYSGTSQTQTFTVVNKASGTGTVTDPYVWEIHDLKIGTEVNFTESGLTVNGYGVKTKFNDTASTLSGKVAAAKAAPTGAFVNTYTRDLGSLKIQKIATVNGKATATALVDGTYTFTVKSATGVTPATTKTVKIEIKDGKVAAVSGDGTRDGEYAVVSGLPTGQYTVSEDTTGLAAKGIALMKGQNTVVTVVKDGTGTIPVAEFVNNKITVKVQKTDVADGKELTGAHIQILDKDGKIVEEWDSVSGKPHEVTCLKIGEKYTLKETVAPDGYTITAETHFTIDENGKVTSDDTTIREDGVLLVEDSKTSVKVQKTDVADGKELTGAHIQILDKNGKVVEEWDSVAGKPHEVTGLKTGEEYTLRETVAPEGYLLTADTKFTIDEDGEISSTGTKTTDKDGNTVLLVEDSRMEYVPASVKKVWEDYSNADGLRPAELEIELLADGVETGETVTLNEENSWTGTINGLEKCQVDGTEIVYSWAEPEVEGYELTGNAKDGTLTTLTNTYTTSTSASVKKAWEDYNNVDKQRPAELKMELLADGEKTGKTVTLNDKNSWTGTIDGLEKYKADGTEIVYSWAEPDVEGYELTGNEKNGTLTTLTNSYSTLTGASVRKLWADYSNADGLRPAELEIELLADGVKTGKMVMLNEENGWSGRIGELEKYKADGTEIAYSWDEPEVEGYELTGNVKDGTVTTLTNTYTTSTSASVKKIWKNDEKLSIRPAELTIELLADGEKTGKTVTLDAANDWTAEIDGLEKYKEDGTEIEYSWAEPAVDGYTLTGNEKDGLLTTLTNTYYGETSATVKKVWQDDGNRDGLRPVTLTVELLADGAKTGQSVKLSAANNWIARIDGLAKYKEDGTEIEYSWTEPAVEGYELTGKETSGTLTVLTNTHGPDETSVSVEKVWVDDGKHPASVKVQLFADGKAEGGVVTLDAANGWKHTWTDLCRNVREAEQSRTIKYTVAEVEIPEGYVATISGNAKTGFVITNTKETGKGKLIIEKSFDIEKPAAEPEEEEMTTDIEVVKVWDDNDNRDGNRPESITVHLYAGGEEIKTATLSEANGWKKTFGELPKFVDGHPIKYTVKEDPVKWYVTEIHGYVITNHYAPETTTVVVRKEWNDEGNEKFRPKSVTMKLNNGMGVILNEENGWTGVISGLPTVVNGEPAVYTWTEASVLGYEVESSVTNGNVTVVTNKPYTREGEPKRGKKPPMRGNLVDLEEYETPLGVEVIINHVGDCFD